jgi:hypothetical protein
MHLEIGRANAPLNGVTLLFGWHSRFFERKFVLYLEMLHLQTSTDRTQPGLSFHRDCSKRIERARIMDHLHWQSLQSETVGNSDMRQSLLYLPWPPWAMRQEIETIPSVSCHPRWPRQVDSDCRCHRHYRVTFANVNMA